MTASDALHHQLYLFASTPGARASGRGLQHAAAAQHGPSAAFLLPFREPMSDPLSPTTQGITMTLAAFAILALGLGLFTILARVEIPD